MREKKTERERGGGLEVDQRWGAPRETDVMVLTVYYSEVPSS